jgi:CheY-like chemotaxis protein
MDGYEATKLIRKEEHRYSIHTPIIALAAHEMEEDLRKAINAGLDMHLTKPIECSSPSRAELRKSVVL